jgi:hypothetical protein
MNPALRRWKARDSKFLFFIVLNLSLLTIYVTQGALRPEPAGDSWRRIDLPALQQKLDKGELSTREADWYHVSNQPENEGFTSVGDP